MVYLPTLLERFKAHLCISYLPLSEKISILDYRILPEKTEILLLYIQGLTLDECYNYIFIKPQICNSDGILCFRIHKSLNQINPALKFLNHIGVLNKPFSNVVPKRWNHMQKYFAKAFKVCMPEPDPVLSTFKNDQTLTKLNQILQEIQTLTDFKKFEQLASSYYQLYKRVHDSNLQSIPPYEIYFGPVYAGGAVEIIRHISIGNCYLSAKKLAMRLKTGHFHLTHYILQADLQILDYIILSPGEELVLLKWYLPEEILTYRGFEKTFVRFFIKPQINNARGVFCFEPEKPVNKIDMSLLDHLVKSDIIDEMLLNRWFAQKLQIKSNI